MEQNEIQAQKEIIAKIEAEEIAKEYHPVMLFALFLLAVASVVLCVTIGIQCGVLAGGILFVVICILVCAYLLHLIKKQTKQRLEQLKHSLQEQS